MGIRHARPYFESGLFCKWLVDERKWKIVIGECPVEAPNFGVDHEVSVPSALRSAALARGSRRALIAQRGNKMMQICVAEEELHGEQKRRH